MYLYKIKVASAAPPVPEAAPKPQQQIVNNQPAYVIECPPKFASAVPEAAPVNPKPKQQIVTSQPAYVIECPPRLTPLGTASTNQQSVRVVQAMTITNQPAPQNTTNIIPPILIASVNSQNQLVLRTPFSQPQPAPTSVRPNPVVQQQQQLVQRQQQQQQQQQEQLNLDIVVAPTQRNIIHELYPSLIRLMKCRARKNFYALRPSGRVRCRYLMKRAFAEASRFMIRLGLRLTQVQINPIELDECDFKLAIRTPSSRINPLNEPNVNNILFFKDRHSVTFIN